MSDDNKEETGLQVYKPTAVDVCVGRWYPYLLNGDVTEARVEKIYQTPDGTLILTITVRDPNVFHNKKTATVDVNNFRMNLLKGGIERITI